MDERKEPQTAEQDYAHHCLTCHHWQGDRAKQWRGIKKSGHVCMSKGGWPISGFCTEIEVFSMTVDLVGDATVDISFDANFGCVHWSPVEESPHD